MEEQKKILSRGESQLKLARKPDLNKKFQYYFWKCFYNGKGNQVNQTQEVTIEMVHLDTDFNNATIKHSQLKTRMKNYPQNSSDVSLYKKRPNFVNKLSL